MSEYVVFSEELLRNFYNPATCSYMVPLSGKAAHDMGVLREENVALQSENDELRKLVRDTLTHPQEYCDKYGIAYCDNAAAWLAMDDDMNRRMRELGIEADE